MAQVTINDGDLGSVIRAAINDNFTETYEVFTGKAGGNTFIMATLTTEGGTIRANAADTTTGTISLGSSLEASSKSVGAVVLPGGLGVGKKLFAGATTLDSLTIGTLAGILKGTAGAVSAATAGTDYAAASSGVAGGQTIAGDTLTTGRLTLRGNAADTTTGGIDITSSTESTAKNVGALTVAGGLGVSGASYLAATHCDSIVMEGTESKGIDFAGVTPAFSDDDDAFIAIGTWNDAKAITGQTTHFVPIQVNLSSQTSVAKDIAAARLRVDTGASNADTAVGCLQLRQKLAHNVASSAILNASININDAVTVGTGSVLGGYFSIEGTGAITKAGDNDCTPLVAVNNNTGGGVDNVFVAMQNGTGTTVSEIAHVVCEHGTATAGINVELTANGTAMGTGLKFTGGITKEIEFQNGETLDNATDGTIACSGLLSATNLSGTNTGDECGLSGRPFRKTVTLTAAAAATPVEIVADSSVATLEKVYITSILATVNGATDWADDTGTQVVIQDNAVAPVAGITVAKTALTGNAVFGLIATGVTLAAPVLLGSGFTADYGISIAADDNFTAGSDLVVTVCGFIK